MNLPLVTIVTPSYQQARFIRATIESVLSQDYPHIEYIVMDGGSTDGTVDVVQPFMNRLTYISEKDRGQTHAINKGFQMAKGEIVAYLNSDDLLLPGAVSKAVQALQVNHEAAAIYGDGYQIDYHGKVKQQFPFTEPFNLWKLTYLMDYILQQSVFFRRAPLEECGWLNEELHYGMDWDILVRLGKRYGLAYVPENLGCLREYEEAKSFAGGDRRFKELAEILRKQTGERRPPGWWFYGLDTYDKIWAARIRRWVPGPAGRYFAMRWIHVCRALIDRVQNGSQGIYSNSWAARTAFWMLPACKTRAKISGVVPDWTPRMKTQVLNVFVNGKHATRVLTGTGPFTFELELPGKTAALLRFEADQASSQQEAGIGGDRRRIAWQIIEIAGLA